MCGQAGLILGRKNRSARGIEALVRRFTELLVGCEPRGPHAAGVAMLNAAGHYKIAKGPTRPSEFIGSAEYQAVIDGVDASTTVIMGHARWSTRGDPTNNLNNHPIRAGAVVGTHNGTIYNADALFRRFRLHRHAEVDSELLFRLANRHTDGRVDVGALAKALKACKGQISAVMAATTAPDTTVILKGNKPLSIRFNRRLQVAAYASEAYVLEDVLGEERGWREIKLPAMTAMTLRHDGTDWAVSLNPIDFIRQTRAGTLPAGVRA